MEPRRERHDAFEEFEESEEFELSANRAEQILCG